MSSINERMIMVHPHYGEGSMYQLHVEHNEFKPERETLVFLHGYLGNNDDYDPLKLKYMDTYNIISFDQRAHGESDAPLDINWSIEDFANDSYQVINSIIQPGCKVHIIASSLATAIALQLTIDYPEIIETLFLISPTNTFSKNILQKIMIEIGKITPDFLLESVVDIFSFVYPLFVFKDSEKKIVQEGFDRMKSMEIAAHRKIFYETTNNVHINVSPIQVPVLIVAGKKDTVVPFKDSFNLNKELKLSTLVSIQNAKHLILKRQADFTSTLLDLWMEERYKLLRYKVHDEGIIQKF